MEKQNELTLTVTDTELKVNKLLDSQVFSAQFNKDNILEAFPHLARCAETASAEEKTAAADSLIASIGQGPNQGVRLTQLQAAMACCDCVNLSEAAAVAEHMDCFEFISTADFTKEAKSELMELGPDKSVIDRCFDFAEYAAMDITRESIEDLNGLAKAVSRLTPREQDKLTAAVLMAEPETASQIRHLAENLEQFEFAPGVKTPADYGRYMIQESGHFEYDPNLDGFYDYESFGKQRIEQESGQFNDAGYISYHGTLSLDEMMMDEPGFQMGGLS